MSRLKRNTRARFRILTSLGAVGFLACAVPEEVPDRFHAGPEAGRASSGGAYSGFDGRTGGAWGTSGSGANPSFGMGGYTALPSGGVATSPPSAGMSSSPNDVSRGGAASALSGGSPSGGASSLSRGGGSPGGSTAAGGSTANGGSTRDGGSTTDGGANVGGQTRGPGGSTASGGAAATSGKGDVPQLPPISGACPQFVTGTATIGGLSGISLQVGAKKQGTGSLLFYWHGTGGVAAEVNTMLPSNTRQEILSLGGIIVSFQSSTGTGGDCSGTATFSKDDFKIADLIAACAVRDHGIDPRRIYTTGCSAGGLQAGCMGALRSSYIAATVPNSGGEVFQLPIQDQAHTPAVMTMHGGASDVVVVTFSQTSATFDKQMKAAGSFVVNCNHGGGHCAAPATLYSAGWEFMKAHPFDVQPEPYASALPATFPSYCMKY